MVEVKLKIDWRDYLFSISNEFKAFSKEVLLRVKEGSKRIFKWILGQILFLFRFEYTRGNIKQHLLNKAASFFGFDMDEGKLKKKKKSKPIRSKYRLNSRKDSLKKQEKTSGGKKRKKKNKKKIAGNIYNPPLELTG